uniref:WD repeat-containing protein 81-like n=1 Tax=Saccoglossus kowalevskii TaxID=10224 RepID=A0ABM0MAJ9_SACKO|nr:PREDICTED: WD repeat-containing protein 81-like [Saccoglossus kowalevskii]
MSEDVATVLCQELCIQRKYIEITDSSEGCILAVALIEDTKSVNPKLNGTVISGTPVVLPPVKQYPRKKVYIQVISKQYWDKHGIDEWSSEKLQSSINEVESGFLSTMVSVAQQNYNRMWTETQRKYLHLSRKYEGDHQKVIVWTMWQKNSVGDLKCIVEKIYGCKVIPLRLLDTTHAMKNTHPNILNVLTIMESQRYFYIVHPYSEYSVHDLVTFSPSIISKSHAKPLFIIYQIIHIMLHCHRQGVALGDVRLKDFMMNEKLWVQLTGPRWRQVQNSVGVASNKNVNTGNDHNDLPGLVQQWVQGKITSYKYLMVLNSLSGRRTGNPNYHPILPWVTDFVSQSGNYRDLTKTKFRLNKGEHQLNFMYSASSQSVPHHFSDLLSDITYHVYFARKTEKSTLCKYVRSSWVPNEYPSSIQRIQEWSPEECIPEFYNDPSIFKSIHNDMSDLQVPPWCGSVDEFLVKHQELLESNHVSSQLHHWIDLTFGYKLSGSAAVNAKNVCLQLVDQHMYPLNHGVVQLFDKPHPQRLSSSEYAGSLKAPAIMRPIRNQTLNLKSYANQKQVVPGTEETEILDTDTVVPTWHDDLDTTPTQFDSEQETIATSKDMEGLADLSSSLESDSFSQRNPIKRLSFFSSRGRGDTVVDSSPLRPEQQTITLPEGYDPLQQLNQLEMLYNFCSTNMKMLPKQPDKEYVAVDQSAELIARDMQTLGCLIVEFVQANKLRMLNPQAGLQERYNIIRKECQSSIQNLPRPVQYSIEVLLQLNNTANNDSLPPPSPSQLLNPYTSIFPFPKYFAMLYEFLSKMHQPMEDPLLKVHLALQYIPKLFVKMNQEGKELLLPYITALFRDKDIALLTVLHLFNKVSRCLGPSMTVEHLLPVIKDLYNIDNYSSPIHLRLYHRSFLSQLLARMGLRVFLNHILDFLVEAVAGRKVCPTFVEAEKTHEMTAIHRSISVGEDALKNLENEALKDDDGEIDDSDDVYTDKRQSDSCSLDQSFGKEDEEAKEDGTSCVDRMFSFRDANERRGSDDVMGQNSCDVDKISLDKSSLHSIGTDSSEIKSQEVGYHSNSSDDINDEDGKEDLVANDGNEEVKPKIDEKIESSTATPDNKMNISALEKHSISLVSGLGIVEVAMDSIWWISQKLGPILTAKYLSRQLLRVLTLCYMGPGQLIAIKDNGKAKDGEIYNCIAVYGDTTTLPVLQCLADIAINYGQSFILNQYISFIKQIVLSAKSKVNTKVEAGLIASMVLLKYMLVYLSDSILMNCLKSFSQNILQPVICILSSLCISFPGGGHARSILCYKLVDVITVIAVRIGREMARENMTALLQQFFCCFDIVHCLDKDQTGSPSVREDKALFRAESEKQSSVVSSVESNDSMYCEIHMDNTTNTYTIGIPVRLKDMKGDDDQFASTPRGDFFEGMESGIASESVRDELQHVFTEQMAYSIYIPLCRLVGSIHMEHILYNHDLIWKLSSSYEVSMAAQISQNQDNLTDSQRTLEAEQGDSDGESSEDIVSGQFGSNVAMVGNRIQISSLQHEQYTKHQVAATPMEDSIKTKCDDLGKSERTLRGNWLSYWEHCLGTSERARDFNIHQIKLSTYCGHTSSVRSLCVLDNETSFMSSSKDKTVKLWSLRNRGDGSSRMSCQWTYNSHKKSVFNVTFLESMRLCASCDSNVHIWDPFTGSRVFQFNMSRNPVSVITPISAPSTSLLAATVDTTLCVLDIRSGKYQQELKVTSGSSGLVRCLSVSNSGNVVAVGFSSGILSLVDIRTGLLLGGWKAHEAEILQVKNIGNSHFVTSSIDHHLTVWGEDGTERAILRGINEPVHSISVYEDQIISATTANKLAVHSNVSGGAQLSYCNKLHSEGFKGVLVCMNTLPMNRLLLLGSDNGNIYLLA